MTTEPNLEHLDRRPRRIDCRANGVSASPAIAAARIPATLELVETMRHRDELKG
jgi:hypothetical protein